MFVLGSARVCTCVLRLNKAPRDCAPVNRFSGNGFLTHLLFLIVGNSAHSVAELETGLPAKVLYTLAGTVVRPAYPKRAQDSLIKTLTVG